MTNQVLEIASWSLLEKEQQHQVSLHDYREFLSNDEEVVSPDQLVSLTPKTTSFCYLKLL